VTVVSALSGSNGRLATRGCPCGFATDPIMANYREYGFKAVLPKPFQPADLSEAMEEVLG